MKKMYSPEPECGVCESTNVRRDGCRFHDDEVTFWRCLDCGELTPDFDDAYMDILEAEGARMVRNESKPQAPDSPDDVL